MSHYLATSVAESPILYVKVQSGRQIEEARKKRRLTQRDLARELGMGVRWLREIEGGNPRSRLDDHLICAYRLGLSTGHILIPLLFAGQKMSFLRRRGNKRCRFRRSQTPAAQQTRGYRNFRPVSTAAPEGISVPPRKFRPCRPIPTKTLRYNNLIGRRTLYDIGSRFPAQNLNLGPIHLL